jgi:hypothetical protein
VAVDGRDRGVLGCGRPAADLAVDSASGYVDVVYFLQAPEGPGVFFSHSMDEGAMFHAPVAVVYGDRPASASVAAHHDTVAVAYEDPNGDRPRIWLALSRTDGHVFEWRGIEVSGANVASGSPRVAVRGRRVAVAWLERSGDGSPARAKVRMGAVR